MLRLITQIAIIVAITAVSAFAQRAGDAMSPRRANTQIFANQVRESFESALATVGPDDLLTIVEVQRQHYRVRTVGGIEGWVERGAVQRAASARAGASRAFTFEAAEVQGYLDNPTPVFIIDMEGGQSDPISLDRSFREALRVNVDRETLERAAR